MIGGSARELHPPTAQYRSPNICPDSGDSAKVLAGGYTRAGLTACIASVDICAFGRLMQLPTALIALITLTFVALARGC